MADPGHLPIADIPVPVSIGAPEDTPCSRSGRSSHNVLPLDTRTEASMGGDSIVLYDGNANREGMPSHATLNMMYQANLQQNYQHNEFTTTNPTLNVVTHDPRITEMIESTAEARHKQVIGQVEIDAMHLQDALRSREKEEMQRTRELMGREAAELRGKFTREAEYEIQRQQQGASSTVEEYKRVIDQNLRQSISNKEQEIYNLRDEALLRDQRQSPEILELRNMVQQQALANEKLPPCGRTPAGGGCFV